MRMCVCGRRERGCTSERESVCLSVVTVQGCMRCDYPELVDAVCVLAL
jgi:hypothetical protein